MKLRSITYGRSDDVYIKKEYGYNMIIGDLEATFDVSDEEWSDVDINVKDDITEEMGVKQSFNEIVDEVKYYVDNYYIEKYTTNRFFKSLPKDEQELIIKHLRGGL